MKKFFNSLQVYRGIAALMVVLHHLYPQVNHFLGFDNSFAKEIAEIGKLGVDFFFVLSGFIIAWTSYNKGGIASYIKPYLKNRFLRIFIPYLPIGLLLFFLYKFFPNISEGDGARNITWQATFFLLPIGSPALGVAWTLMYELLFYIIFSLWFFSKRALMIAISIWMTILLGQLFFFKLQPDIKFLGMLLSYYNIEFLFGVFIAFLYKKNKIPDRTILLVSSATLFGLFLYYYKQTHNLKIGIIFALSCAFLMAGSLNSKLDNINKNAFVMKIGNASYSIYLIHGTIISILVRIIAKLAPQVPTIISMPLIILICMILGTLYSQIFEIRALKFIKKVIE